MSWAEELRPGGVVVVEVGWVMVEGGGWVVVGGGWAVGKIVSGTPD